MVILTQRILCTVPTMHAHATLKAAECYRARTDPVCILPVLKSGWRGLASDRRALLILYEDQAGFQPHFRVRGDRWHAHRGSGDGNGRFSVQTGWMPAILSVGNRAHGSCPVCTCTTEQDWCCTVDERHRKKPRSYYSYTAVASAAVQKYKQ